MSLRTTMTPVAAKAPAPPMTRIAVSNAPIRPASMRFAPGKQGIRVIAAANYIGVMERAGCRYAIATSTIALAMVSTSTGIAQVRYM